MHLPIRSRRAEVPSPRTSPRTSCSFQDTLFLANHPPDDHRLPHLQRRWGTRGYYEMAKPQTSPLKGRGGFRHSLGGLQNARGRAEVRDAMGLFPSKPRTIAPEVSVAGGLEVDGSAQIEVLDDLGRLERERLTHDPL